MDLPLTQAIYAFKPADPAFHQALLSCAEQYVLSHDLSSDAAQACCPAPASEKYGYGGMGLYPYGYYHPTVLLPAIGRHYSRGRLARIHHPLHRPDYIYRYAADGSLCQIECRLPVRESWPAPQLITYLCPAAEPASPLALSYMTRNRHSVPMQLYGLAWTEVRGSIVYRYHLRGMFDQLNFSSVRCETELTEPWQDRLLVSRVCCSRISDRFSLEPMSAELELT